MRGSFFKGVILGSLTAVLVLGASAALAGTGVGAVFNLGQSNTVNGTSSVSGSTAGAQFAVSNSSTNSAARGLSVAAGSTSAALLAQNGVGPAAKFQTPTGVTPFLVNSTAKVVNLNADQLDGIDSGGFVQGKGKLYTLAVSVPRHTDGSNNIFIPTRATSPGFANIGFACPPIAGAGSFLDVENDNSSEPNIFFRNNDFTGTYAQIPVSGAIAVPTLDGGDLTSLTIQGVVSGLQTVTTATISTVVRSSDCLFQVQALTSSP